MITVNPKTRAFSIPPVDAIAGAMFDKDVSVKRISIPRFTDTGMDMSNGMIRIVYINAASESYPFYVLDMDVSENNVQFDWEISRACTETAGPIIFVVCVRWYGADGTISNEWHTGEGKLTVVKSHEIGEGEYDEEDLKDALGAAIERINAQAEQYDIPTIKRDVSTLKEDLNSIDERVTIIEQTGGGEGGGTVNGITQAQADARYVQMVNGKGLSTNDYDATAKAKVDAIPANPKYTDTVYNDSAIRSLIAGKANGAGITFSIVDGGLVATYEA